MRCRYCNTPIKSFANARLETLHGEKRVCCSDLEACKVRAALFRAELRKQDEDAWARHEKYLDEREKQFR